MSTQFENIQRQHPCFAKGGMAKTGRIHLPVSPGCNIGCVFCCPAVNDNKQAPAVTRKIMKPEQAVSLVSRSLELCPSIKVVGIAGPGDTLATDKALETFRQVGKAHPQLLKCMSTNGLLLPERVEELVQVGIDTLTVTVNAVDPAIEAQLNTHIIYHGKRIEGQPAACILIENQLKGIKLAAQAGITVKVNTVLAPGINDSHIEDIAKAVSEAGATIYNIIPLIPQGKLENVEPPTCKQIDAARQKAEKHLPVFRHCQHCRADAIGIPGEKDYGDQIYLRRVAGKETFSHG